MPIPAFIIDTMRQAPRLYEMTVEEVRQVFIDQGKAAPPLPYAGQIEERTLTTAHRETPVRIYRMTEDEAAPVLVYVHGGSLQSGQPWYRDYSGEGLAHEGVIVVNFGYRLGIFGFFADEALQAESETGTTGNYGLLDQIMALRWVQDNIAAFGGDPGNVTLSGESAGAACVSALCTSPLAKGLFRRVVAESSTVTAPKPAHSFRSLKEAFEAGKKT
ncbi:MAG: carboxylesterase family protein, partial [Lachnospiraceae bacterium]|nr:carboxylesterase family protein [Lachnospiraceae bacterium]